MTENQFNKAAAIKAKIQSLGVVRRDYNNLKLAGFSWRETANARGEVADETGKTYYPFKVVDDGLSKEFPNDDLYIPHLDGDPFITTVEKEFDFFVERVLEHIEERIQELEHEFNVL